MVMKRRRLYTPLSPRLPAKPDFKFLCERDL
jgi:hypothetical protein